MDAFQALNPKPKPERYSSVHQNRNAKPKAEKSEALAKGLIYIKKIKLRSLEKAGPRNPKPSPLNPFSAAGRKGHYTFLLRKNP